MQGRAELDPGGPTFAWAMLGKVDLAPGRHSLQIRVERPGDDGRYLLSQDCFMIAPQLGSVLCISGSRKPLLVRLRVGEGELLISQLLLAGRLSRESPDYDPAAERLFLNLLSC